MELSQKLKIKISYDTEIPFLGMYPKELKSEPPIALPTHCSTIPSSQNVETT